MTVASLGGCSGSTHHTRDHQGMKADFDFNDNSQSSRHALDLTSPAQCFNTGVCFPSSPGQNQAMPSELRGILWEQMYI